MGPDDVRQNPIAVGIELQSCATLSLAMAERRLIILNYLSGVPAFASCSKCGHKVPAFASCSKCGHKFFAPAALQFDRSEARDYLEYKFLLHECPREKQTTMVMKKNQPCDY